MNLLIKDRALVLSVLPLRESDYLVSMLASKHGKIKAVARGARRSKKRFMGGIDAFACGEIEIRKSKNQSALPTLESISGREVWLGLRRNLTRFSLASYCLELAEIFSQEDDQASSCYYEPLFNCINQLNQSISSDECYALVTQLNLKILALGGINPLDNTINIKPEQRTWWLELLANENCQLSAASLALAQPSFLVLSAYTEQTIGHSLKSPNSLRTVNF